MLTPAAPAMNKEVRWPTSAPVTPKPRRMKAGDKASFTIAWVTVVDPDRVIQFHPMADVVAVCKAVVPRTVREAN